MPDRSVFGPLGPGKGISKTVIMTVGEYETIRLIDFEGMTQEECSENMAVARTTVQRIYNDARKKIAGIFIDGDIVKIEGGDYQLYSNAEQLAGYGRCRRHRSGQIDPGYNKNIYSEENKK